tara:strand:- start:22016 stop:22243 length:228 start_codon:yes stop_codon:yes gene_type:complete
MVVEQSMKKVESNGQLLSKLIQDNYLPLSSLEHAISKHGISSDILLKDRVEVCENLAYLLYNLTGIPEHRWLIRN